MKANETYIHPNTSEEQVLLMRYINLGFKGHAAGQVCPITAYTPATV